MSPSADNPTLDPTLDLRSVATVDLPRALGEAYDRIAVGSQIAVRFPTALDQNVARDLVEGGGFVERERRGARLVIERVRTLPDRVAPGMRVLLCGLNPSVYAADAGVGFARPGNRFWPAALASGLLTVDRDPRHALAVHGVGMTDLVKRASARADQIARPEYVAGAARVARLCTLLSPRLLCVVGITGWRIAVDKAAVMGEQADRIGSTLVYVMANPSGVNAHVTTADLAAELRTVAGLADHR